MKLETGRPALRSAARGQGSPQGTSSEAPEGQLGDEGVTTLLHISAPQKVGDAVHARQDLEYDVAGVCRLLLLRVSSCRR